MDRKVNVLSLFDGISCGQIALEKENIKIDNYFASEIDKYAIKVTQQNYPNTIQLGDVSKIKGKDLPKIDLLIGGSPCQGFSFAGKQLNFEDKRSKLFFEYTRLLEETQPKYFLLENVIMKEKYIKVISNILKVKPVEINSNLVSAQNRNRLYWTNIVENIKQPKNKNIKLKDIIEKNINNILTDNYIEKRKKIKRWGNHFGTVQNYKSNTLCAIGKSDVLLLTDLKRFLLPIECERLQTIPDNYTNIVSNSHRYRLIGNSWTVDIIAYIFSYLNKKQNRVFFI